MSEETTTWYFVSDDPDRITWPMFNEDHMTNDNLNHPHYRTEKDAVDAITDGRHGEAGTLYVIKAELTVAQTARRGWTLHAGERPPGWNPNAPADPFESAYADPPSPTGSGV